MCVCACVCVCINIFIVHTYINALTSYTSESVYINISACVCMYLHAHAYHVISVSACEINTHTRVCARVDFLFCWKWQAPSPRSSRHPPPLRALLPRVQSLNGSKMCVRVRERHARTCEREREKGKDCSDVLITVAYVIIRNEVKWLRYSQSHAGKMRCVPRPVAIFTPSYSFLSSLLCLHPKSLSSLTLLLSNSNPLPPTSMIFTSHARPLMASPCHSTYTNKAYMLLGLRGWPYVFSSPLL